MRDFLEQDIEMFKNEEKNILREMRGNRGHSVMVRQLLDRINDVQLVIERLESERDGACNKCCTCSPKKEIKKAVVKPAVKK